MFGKPTPQPQPQARPQSSEVAKIQGGGLVQVIIPEIAPLTYYLFLNERYVPQTEIESLSVSVEAPGPDVTSTIVRATLEQYVHTVSGEISRQRTELFPCTIEIIAVGRRIAVTCATPNSLDGVWINLGLRADGTSADVNGLRALEVLITEGIVDARLTWNDGATESIFPQD